MKLVLFDCDGTIIDSQHVIVAAMAGAFAGAGLAVPPREKILSVVGLSLLPAVARLLPPGVDAAIAGAVACDYKANFSTLRQDPANHEPLYPGALAVLHLLHGRGDVVLGIATGKSRRGVDIVMEREGLAHMFSTIQTADDHPSKPHPSMIERAMAEAGVTTAVTVMIGDTTYDMEMARAAGAAAIGVAWGYHEVDHLMEAGATSVVHHFSEVPAAIDAALARQEAVA